MRSPPRNRRGYWKKAWREPQPGAFFARLDSPLSPAARERFEALRRLAREPAAYITGQHEFYGLDFRVTSAVLIPAPGAEMPVEAALKRLRTSPRLRPPLSIAQQRSGDGGEVETQSPTRRRCWGRLPGGARPAAIRLIRLIPKPLPAAIKLASASILLLRAAHPLRLGTDGAPHRQDGADGGEDGANHRQP